MVCMTFMYTDTPLGAEHYTQDTAMSKEHGRPYEVSVTALAHLGAASTEHCGQEV